jgi:hypothetical protein
MRLLGDSLRLNRTMSPLPRFRFALLLVLTLSAACSKKESAPAQPPTCDVQAQRYGVLLASAFVKQGMPGAETKIPAAVVAACNEDHWPDTVPSCLSAVRPGKENYMEACINSLSPELQQKMETRVKAAMAN